MYETMKSFEVIGRILLDNSPTQRFALRGNQETESCVHGTWARFSDTMVRVPKMRHARFLED